jgi:phosphate transport system permease protein
MSTVPISLTDQDPVAMTSNSHRRKRNSRIFYGLCVAIACLSVVVLVVLLASIGFQGHTRIRGDLIKNSHSELNPDQAGMRPAIIGSLAVCAICALAALPLGVGTAVFLEEFQPRSKPMRWLHGFIQLNIANLAGVPSIVYGLLGLTVFVYMFNVFGQIKVNESSGLELFGVQHYYQILSLEPGQTVLVPKTDMTQKTFKVTEPIDGFDAAGNPIKISVWNRKASPKPTDKQALRQTVKLGAIGGSYSKHAWYYFRLPFGKSFVAAGLTLALVILPVIIIASQEALRSVSPSLREASLGMGATTWQTVRNVCLPAAIPGIMTGAILAMGRAIGEAAPVLVVLGAAVAKNSGPQNLMDSVVTMPVLIFNWAGRPQDVYQEISAAAIIVLLAVLLILNSVAIIVRGRMQTR